ncbi:MAG: hypothetical protein C4336_03390 [Armatimonadota bacterium]
MSMGKRVTRLMKAYLSHHWERISAIIHEEEQEARARQEALNELTKPPSSPPPADVASKPETDTELRRAYQTLGLEVGASLSVVRRQYRTLSQRVNPERFPEGSPERERAEQIQARIERAYQTLLAHLDPSSARFRNLGPNKPQ